MRKLTKEEFIIKSKKLHNENFNYEEFEYINQKVKSKLICKIHGEFSVTPDVHLHSAYGGCTKCRYTGSSKTQIDDISTIDNKIKKIHRNNYTYILLENMKSADHLEIKCNMCNNIFHMRLGHFIAGSGCKCVSKSKGELLVENILINNNIKYYYDFSFSDCVDIRKLRFDFYLVGRKTIIEVDGVQHIKPTSFSKTFICENDHIRLEDQIKKDKIKDEYCRKNNIRLIRLDVNTIRRLKTSDNDLLKYLD